MNIVNRLDHKIFRFVLFNQFFIFHSFISLVLVLNVLKEKHFEVLMYLFRRTLLRVNHVPVHYQNHYHINEAPTLMIATLKKNTIQV